MTAPPTGPGGPRSPLRTVPARRPGSVRRTVQLDIGPPDGRGVAPPRAPGGDPAAGDDVVIVVTGSARDLRTDAAGDPVVAAAATVDAGFDATRRTVRLATTPESPWAATMLGQRAGGGFRRALAQGDPGVTDDSLVRQLLDDLPAAVLISGYSWMRLARIEGHEPRSVMPPEALPRVTDVCAGWRDGGTAVESVRRGQGVPLQHCPPATDLCAGDPLAFHQMAELRTDHMRRRRCIDVMPLGDGTAEVWAMFRDTAAEEDGVEVVLHEYSLTFSLDLGSGVHWTVAAAEARPHVLPFPECPAAATSVAATVGARLGDLGAVVADRLDGVRSCTHLNDLLRSVGRAAPLLVDAGGTRPGA